jgi:hypothetical protein
MMKWVRFGSLALLTFAFTACGSLGDLTDLEVINENNPDRERALQEAGDIESLISSGFFIWHDGVYEGSPASGLSVAGEEGSASWGNFGAQQIGTEPRVAWPNSPSWRYASLNRNPWYDMYAALSSVYDGLVAIELQPELCEDIDCDRAHAFARFIQGISHGFVALMYDSAFVFDETVDLQVDVLAFVPYPNVAAAAEGYLNDAISESNGASWSLPSSWIRGNAWSAAEFNQFVHSHAARLLYQVAREPAEHAAANWNTIIGHVNAGITSGMAGLGGSFYGKDGVFLEGDPTQTWRQQLNYYGNQTAGGSWHRADYKSIGAYDQGTAYSDWLAASLNDRDDFVLNTADERVHPPGAGDEDGLDFIYKGTSPFPSARGTYFYSMYMNANYEEYANEGRETPMPQMLYNTQQLIKAEGLARTGDLAGAALIVDRTRVGRANLPPASTTDLNQLLQEIWYEHLIENYYVCTGCAYFPRRGWEALSATGPNHHWGLVEGTPLHFAPPGKELEILQHLNWTWGGVGNEGGTLQATAAGGLRMGSTVPASAVYQFNDLGTAVETLDYIWTKYGTRDGPSGGVTNLVRH